MRPKTVIAATAVFFATIVSALAADDEAAQILKLYQERQTAQADARLDAYLQKNPEADSRCGLLLAAATADRSLFDARQRLRQTADQCEKSPEGAKALAELARVLHLAGQDRPAMLVCDEFLAKHPNDAQAPAVLLLRGAAELRLPAGATASDSFTRFLARYPGDPRAAEALAGLGDVKLRRGDYRDAEEAYLRALAAAPGSLDLPRVYFNLGTAAEKQGRRDAARRYYEELIRSWGDSAVAAQARDRLDSALAAGPASGQPLVEREKYAASVGVFPSLQKAEAAAEKFTAAGMRVHLTLRGRACELLVGEFDSEAAAALFAKELAKRYQVVATPARLP
jgi:tetratricopeptide (TPR) repeat protein